jgi:hypothetical protein
MKADWGAMRPWQRLGLRRGDFLLTAMVVGLPINDVFKYTLLLGVAVAVFAGVVFVSLKRWIDAAVLGALVMRWQPALCARVTRSAAWDFAGRGFIRLQTFLNPPDGQSTSATLPR